MLRILDTTLREGEQTPGVCFDGHIKMAIASLLDAVGVDVIEAGHPAVTGSIRSAVADIAGSGLRARVAAHARSLKPDVDLALDCGVDFLGVFYCVSEERLQHHSRPLVAAVDRITEVIAHALAVRPELVVRYTPEDTVRSRWHNVVAAAAAAVEAGATVISVADTTGALLPGETGSMYAVVCRLRDALAAKGLEPQIAVHCHNDRGLALANAVDGIRAGATLVDATVLGLGERAGLVDLATLLAVLAADLGHAGRWDLTRLDELYALVSRFSGVPIPVNQPVTGANAFTHCAGVHTQAALADPYHYQSLDPHLVGRNPHIALDHMSGLAAVQHALEAIGEDASDRHLAESARQRIKRIGESGRTVELDELALLVRHLRSAQEAA